MRSSRPVVALAMLVVGAAGAFTQDEPAGPSQERVNAANQAVRDAFLRTAPKQGEALPEIMLLDADGQPFSLSSLKGNYTVLVFGCLT